MKDSLDRPEQFICPFLIGTASPTCTNRDRPFYRMEIVSATINENTGMIVDEIYRHRPDILAATTWLFNHEQLMHISFQSKSIAPKSLPGAGRSGISGRQ